MSSKLDMRPEDREKIMDEFINDIEKLFAESSSGKDFKNNMETHTSNERINREEDGVDPTDDSDEESFNDKRKEYADLYVKFVSSEGAESDNYLNMLAEMESKYPELVNDCVVDQILSKMMPQQAAQKATEHTAYEINENKAQTDKFYYKTEEDKKPVTSEGVYQSFGSNDIDLNNLGRNFSQREQPKAFYEECRKAAQNEWADTDKVAYKKNTYESNGKTVEYTMAAQKVDWGSYISRHSNSLEDNIYSLRRMVTDRVKEYFGGFNRITSIVVRSQQLIVNNICYMPLIDPNLLKDASVFPLDTLDYLRNGYIAPLFNWYTLKLMSNLAFLDIDDTNFYITEVATDLGLGRRAGLTTIFRVVPSLNTFVLNGNEVGVDDQYTDKGRIVKEDIARHKHFLNFSDGYKLNVYACTNGIQNWTVNNLKTFATNRGNRGIFRFSAGVVGRGLMAGVAGIVNLGAHLIGAVGQVFKQAMTDVTEEDLN